MPDFVRFLRPLPGRGTAGNGKPDSMTYAAERVLAELPRYKGEWAEVYLPIRQMLAGDWDSFNGRSHLHLRFDTAARFLLECAETDLLVEGTYTVVAHSDAHYLALEALTGQTFVLRIDDLDRANAILRIETEEGGFLELKRRVVSRAFAA
ncbi:MAG: hypothetical protein C4341_00840 [Armatimonadota bacterium]